MSTRNTPLPLGLLLEKAGLIDANQLQHALEFQLECPSMKLGEILVLQEGIESKTISFFVEKWQDIKQQGQQFPIGYYLKIASLLNDRQIENILTEQKVNKLKFGDIAVHKGWLKQNTINFFLNSLSIKPQEPLSLISLEKYNQENLYLERKYANPSLILSRVLGWTGGNPHLTKAICHVFANSNLNIPAGLETNAVDQFVEKSLIKEWQTSEVGTYIRTVKENLVDNQRCLSILLLEEYRQILLSDSQPYQNTKEQKELLILGIISLQKNKLKVSNLIYQQIFNQDWIALELSKLKTEDSPSLLATTNITKYIAVNQSDTPKTVANIDQKSNTPDPITRMISLLILGGIILLIPLVIALDNYYLSGKQEPKIVSPPQSEADKLNQFCNDLNLADPESASDLISQLERNKQNLLKNFPSQLEIFPQNCEISLNKLRVLAAPQLGKQNRVIEAIKNLCNIPSHSASITEARVWLERWYDSPSWGKETKSYIDLVPHCPASSLPSLK